MTRYTLTLLLLIATPLAHAGVEALRVTQVDNGGVVTEFGGMVVSLENTVTNDLAIDFSGALGAIEILVELDAGAVFNTPVGIGGSDTAPFGVLADAFPATGFDTFVGLGATRSNADGYVPTSIYGGPVTVGAAPPPNATPQGGVDKDFNGDGRVDAYDTNIMNTYWGQDLPPGFFGGITNPVNSDDMVFRNWGAGSSGPGSASPSFDDEQLGASYAAAVGESDILDRSDFPVARITLSDDAWGTLRFFATAIDDFGPLFGGGEPLEVTLPISAGVIGLNAPVPGDFDSDFRVDNSDLSFLLNNWGSSSVPALWTNGFTAPAVNNDELNALLDWWGYGTGVSAAVPEPSTVALLLLVAPFAPRRSSH
ncbi:MAG: hypothetical protein AAFV43_07420 [Planctomycetota bacterium]